MLIPKKWEQKRRKSQMLRELMMKPGMQLVTIYQGKAEHMPEIMPFRRTYSMSLIKSRVVSQVPPQNTTLDSDKRISHNSLEASKGC